MTWVLVFLCVMALLNWASAIRLEKAKPLKTQITVSLLVPVRNESARIENLISSVSKLVSESVEVLILDDESTDGTWEKLKKIAQPEIRLIQGKALPEKWVGKSWACSQLAELAKGEILLFCDADVLVSDKAIERTVSLMEEHQVDALTALPYQNLLTVIEKAVIPFVMQLPIWGLLPLRWLCRLQSPHLLVANGQWFAFRRSVYWKVGGHGSVAFSLLEDMELGRNLVKNGFKLLPVLATEDIQVRMYDSWPSMKEGFTKNLFLLAGGKNIPVGVIFGLSLWIYLGPLVLTVQEKSGAGVMLFLLVLFRVLTALSFRMSLVTVFLHPLGAFGFLFLLARSWAAHVKNRVLWRGRWVQAAN